MLRLLLVTYKQDSGIHAQENSKGLAHGSDILEYLTVPWANYEWGVFADSCFDPASSSEEMMQLGLGFIGVMKTATKNSPWIIYQEYNSHKVQDSELV